MLGLGWIVSELITYWSLRRLCSIDITGLARQAPSRYQVITTLQWRHNGQDGVSNHQPHDCLLHRLFRRRSKKTSKLRATGLCVENSPETGEFPTQRASNVENVSIWWRHHEQGISPVSASGAFMNVNKTDVNYLINWLNKKINQLLFTYLACLCVTISIWDS